MKNRCLRPILPPPPSLWLFVVFIVAGLCPSLPSRAAEPALTDVAVRCTYDGNGNVLTRIDGNGALTTYTYDELNHLKTIDYPDGATPDVTFTYDTDGRRTGMDDWTGHTEWQYDVLGRLISVVHPNGGFIQYGYDLANNITDLRYGFPNSTVTLMQYTFDEENRLTSATNVGTSETTTYTYNDAGEVLRRTLPNGVTSDYSYDTDGRFIGIDHSKEGGTRVAQFTYALDTDGKRIQLNKDTADSGQSSLSFQYDSSRRLKTALSSNGASESFTYDALGNRTEYATSGAEGARGVNYSYDSENRLLRTTSNGQTKETFFYDRQGSLMERRPGDGSMGTTYTYDYERRLVAVSVDGLNIQYRYNGDGELVSLRKNGVETLLLNDCNSRLSRALVEYTPGASDMRVYIYGNELLMEIEGDGSFFPILDSIDGSIERWLDRAGTTIATNSYTSFGAVTSFTGIRRSLGFHCERQEPGIDLVFLRARFYDPTTGRFLTRDGAPTQALRPSSLHRYTFAENDPVNNRDPSGCFIQAVVAARLAIGVGVGVGAYYLTHDENERTATGYLLAGVAGAVGPLGNLAKLTAAESVVVNGVSALVSGYGLSSATNAFDRSVDAIGSGAGTLVPNPFTGINFRNTQYFSGLLTFGNVGNLAKEAGNAIFGAITDYTFTDLSVGKYLGITRYNPAEYNLSFRIGGVALNKSASVLLPLNTITGGTFDPATGQIVLFGQQNDSPSALPPMSLDDLAVAVRAGETGTSPVVSIEDPVVNSPLWPGRSCYTVRYGPYYTDPVDGRVKVLDVSSNTHFGWVMFEADRLMKSLCLGRDNRTGQGVSSNVPGYRNLVNLALDYRVSRAMSSRFWFNPQEIVIISSEDGDSMRIASAKMQLSTESMFASAGQVESTPDAEYFARWVTNNYDALAEEQVSQDNSGRPHRILKELKQLAYTMGVVKWIKENDIPVDLEFLKRYQPQVYPEAPMVTPQMEAVGVRPGPNGSFNYIKITGGVDFCTDLVRGSGTNPSGLAAAATGARPNEGALAWTFNSGGTNYNASALSVDRTAKPGGSGQAAVDAHLAVNGAMPLVLGRYFDSFDSNPTLFGYGWKAQPYALEFRSAREQFSLCHQTWNGYGEVYFVDRTSQSAYQFVAAGIYDTAADPRHLASRFAPGASILVYRFQSGEVPGLLFSDNSTGMTMRMANGMLLDFNLDGVLLRVEDRNGNRVEYGYDGNKRLTGIGQPGGRGITLSYDNSNRVSSAALPGGRTVAYTYDTAGNLAQTLADGPNGRKLRYAYGADHQITEVLDEAGAASATANFDVYGRVSSTTQPGVDTPFSQSYNLAARTSNSTGPEGVTQSTVYNDQNDPIEITDARGRKTKLEYNGDRSPTVMTRADGEKATLYYDSLGRRVATVTPGGRADVTWQDENGNPVISFHAPAGPEFAAAFDNEHRVTTGDFPYYTTGITEYAYDTKGNLTGITDANGHTRTRGYDAKGNPSFSKDARGKQTTYTVDPFSRLTRVTDPMGRQVNMTYDARDNLTQVATLAGTLDYTYNEKGQMASITTGDSGARRTTQFTYNAKGQIATVREPNNVLTEYAYDARGNLTQIVQDAVARFTFEYDGQNRLVATKYRGTAGGARASIIPISPVGGERLPSGPITVRWSKVGEWEGGNGNVTLQYSLDGVNWIDIATVSADAGNYVWAAPVNSPSLRLRFVRPGDGTFASAATGSFAYNSSAHYYVNDANTTGDVFCTAIGRAYNGTTVTGRTPADPVNDPQDIIDHYALQPGDVVHLDTGNYTLDHDIEITEEDSGSPAMPLTFEGPSSGAGAVFTRADSSNPNNNGVWFLRDSDDSDTVALQNVVLSRIKTIRGRAGIWLYGTIGCQVRKCDTSYSAVVGAAGELSRGFGILVNNGTDNTVEGCVSHHNGAAGAPALGTGAGGESRATGIFVYQETNCTIRNNECCANQATGAPGGAPSSPAGLSQGHGIYVSESSRTSIIENSVHDNAPVGVSSTNGSAGDAFAYGIAAINSSGTVIERNVCANLSATGGSSSSRNGGDAFARGIQLVGETGPGARVTFNIARGIQGTAGNGGSGSSANHNGRAQVEGVLAGESSDTVIVGNLFVMNNATAGLPRGLEIAGTAGCRGVSLFGSPDCVIAHNTVEGNRPRLTVGTTTVDGADAQILLGYSDVNQLGSTGATVKNNIAGGLSPSLGAFYFDSASSDGVVSDYNDWYAVAEGAALASNGGAFVTDLGTWRNVSGLDSHSLSADPFYWDGPNGNYHLRAQSPVVDRGMFISSIKEDIDGEPRPKDGPDTDATADTDMGYDEFVDTDEDGLADIIELQVTHTSTTRADSDRDGLPDAWEVAHHLDPNSGAGDDGAEGNPDHDAYTNLQEYLGGSDPRLNNSTPSQGVVITFASPSASNLLILEEESVAFSAAASDSKGNSVTYEWRVDGSLKSSTGSFVFQTDGESSGANTLVRTYQVELSAKAGASITKRLWTVVVKNRNHAPVLQHIANVSVQPGDTIEFHSIYFDPDNQNAVAGDDNTLTVTYSGFMSSASKLVSSTDRGPHTVVVTVQDNGIPPLKAQQSVHVEVFADGENPTGTNAPVISSTTSAYAVQGEPFTYQISATNSPTSFAAIGMPAGLVVDSATGQITGIPTVLGAAKFTIVANNAEGRGLATLTLTVGTTPAGGDAYLWTTLAGSTRGAGSRNGTGSDARFAQPFGVTVDRRGNLYVADTYNHVIRKITPAGVASTFAGTDGIPGSSDGFGSTARFNFPFGLAIDARGNVLVADSVNHAIRQITPIGVVTTLAGNAHQNGFADGLGAMARFSYPSGIATDALGTIFVSDTENHVIRRIASGTVSTLAGSGGSYGSADGTGADARFHSPRGIALGPDNNLYVADINNSAIRRITPAGAVTTIAGQAGANDLVDATGSSARFFCPNGITVDPAGNFYIGDTYNHAIRKMTMAGVVTTVANPSGIRGSSDGAGTVARFNKPTGMATDRDGNIYVADLLNSEIRKITPAGMVSTLAGSAPEQGNLDGTGTTARFFYPDSVALDADGNVYTTDFSNHTIRKITPAGIVTTFAGMAQQTGSADGLGESARFFEPSGLTLDAGGTIYVADQSNHTIRKISPVGSVSTLAGSPGQSGSADGTGDAARFSNPGGVAVDSAGTVYVTDYSNHTIRKITPAGNVNTLAGSPGIQGQEDGVGLAARFTFPRRIAVDGLGNLFVAGGANIRKITPAGIVTTVPGSFGVYPASNISFYTREAAVDAAGNLYAADQINHVIRKITPAGVASTIGGLALADAVPGNVDGIGSTARFNIPCGLTVNAAASLIVVADTGNHRIVVGRRLSGRIEARTYAGLIEGVTGAREEMGRFSVSIRPSGTFTLKGILGGKSFSFAGSLDSAGTFKSRVLDRAGHRLILRLDPDRAGRALGTIIGSDLSTFAAVVANEVPVFSAKTPSPFAGFYTFTFPPDPTQPSSSYPQGTGYASMKVSATGQAVLSGVLGDGTALTAGGSVTAGGELSLYLPLYTNRGYFSGRLNLHGPTANDVAGGSLRWMKLPTAGKAFGAGFSGEIVAEGSGFQRGTTHPRVLEMADGGTLSVSGGNVGLIAPANFTLDSSNRVTFTSPASFKLKFLPSPVGQFSGAFPLSGTNKTRLQAFRGVVLQKQNRAFGLFKGDKQTGTISVLPSNPGD